ncbi:uncharacterized protein LOC105690603 [Athalia rosae]|uniref:uncharacterized protein LOC105690603 n=1 Tax=Athalia rosae TaxID=37344 RepID=UPI00203342B2|nr:uncharacterized protein LOC105690603 [Athalia rosae]
MLLPQFIYVLGIIGIVTADNIMQKAIKAFADSNFVTCHILLFTYSDSFREQKMLQEFYQVAIQNNFIPTALENMNDDQRRNGSTSIRRDCVKPLRSFIMGNVTYIAEYMIAEKRKGNIATDIWLLFVANDFDQELIISQVELSISSEVYIVRRTPNGYKFWEIYRPTKNNPVRVIYHGDWSFAGGFKTTQQSKIQRRWDFGGAVFRAAAVDMKSYKNLDLIRTVKVLATLWQTLEKEFNFT